MLQQQLRHSYKNKSVQIISAILFFCPIDREHRDFQRERKQISPLLQVPKASELSKFEEPSASNLMYLRILRDAYSGTIHSVCLPCLSFRIRNFWAGHKGQPRRPRLMVPPGLITDVHTFKDPREYRQTVSEPSLCVKLCRRHIADLPAFLESRQDAGTPALL